MKSKQYIFTNKALKIDGNMLIIRRLLLLAILHFCCFIRAEDYRMCKQRAETKIFSPSPAYSKKIIEGGTYVHFGVILPSKNYFLSKGATNKTNDRFNIGFGLELGELFQLNENRSNTSFSLRLTIVNAQYTSYSDSGKKIHQILQGSAFDFGPCLTFGLDEKNALDFYYQLCPTYMFNTQDTANYTNSGAFGLIHSFGIGYRFNLLSIGAAYNRGNARYIDASKNENIYKRRLDHFRFYIGLMF